MDFKPDRISRCSTIDLAGGIEEVFPLFGPVREKDWAHGWDPEIQYPAGGIAEEGMLFRTVADNGSDGHYQWILMRLDRESHLIAYAVSAPGRIWFIRVQCRAGGKGTTADISYTYTGLSPGGSARNREAMDVIFAHDLRDWEEAINNYLKNGKLPR